MSDVPAAWSGLVDDAAIFPPGDVPAAGRGDGVPGAPRRVVRRPGRPARRHATPISPRSTARVPVSVVLTGGAGAVAGVAALAAKKGHRVVGLEAAVRDLDDLAGNVRRITTAVDAARDDGRLADTQVYVELPQTEPDRRLAGRGRRGRRGRASPEVPHRRGRGAPLPVRCRRRRLDRRRARPRDAVQVHGRASTTPSATATTRPASSTWGSSTSCSPPGVAFDGGSVAETTQVLDDHYAQRPRRPRPAERPRAGARRWFTSYGSCSVSDPLDDLVGLGLLEPPPTDPSDQGAPDE